MELGELSIEKAMLQAGYAESTARQQSEVMRNLRENSAMQDALREIGVDENRLAREIKSGLSSFGHVKRAYVELGVKLLDGFPSEKHSHTFTPVGYDELETPAKAKRPEEARKMAAEA